MKTRYIAIAALALMGTLATRSNAAATDASQTKFNAGDKIAVSTNDQEAVIYQLQDDGQTWRETETNKFLLWNASQLEFSAYYPVTTGTSMTESCYNGMFYGCSKLASVTCKATDISAESCLYDWLHGARTVALLFSPSQPRNAKNSAETA